MQKEYQFLTDYAKSDRSRCKLCQINIDKNSLRLALIIQSPKFDGKITNWYHFNCFFKKNKVRAIEDVQNIELLRWDDREKIKFEIEKKSENGVMSMYSIEYAKSNKSKCGFCKSVITKDSIRISCKELDSENAKISWHHIDCFSLKKKEVIKETPNFDVSLISGFYNLSDEDSKDVISKFKNWKTKKRCIQEDENINISNKHIKKDLHYEENFKAQNELLWSIRDRLERELSQKELIILLQYNKQFIPSGKDNILDAISDAMVFGCLNSCPECKGYLLYFSNKYVCKSNVSDWVKCLYETIEVQRSEFKIPSEYTVFEVMKSYYYVSKKRVLLEESKGGVSDASLKGFLISISGLKWNNGYTKSKIEKKIKSLGGKVTKHIDCNTAVLIYATEGDKKVKKRSGTVDFIALAQQYNVDVVGTEIFEDIENGEDFVKSVKKRNVMPWGRSEAELRSLKLVGMEYCINQTDSTTLTMKSGSVVDPDSKLQNKAHVYRDPESQEYLNLVLGMVDLVLGSNSFYKLQLLESDHKKKWWVFRSWGRIGTNIGSSKTESFNILSDALDNFEEIYFDKTGNMWKGRHQFKKQHNRFYPMDVDYGDQSMIEDLSIDRKSKTLSSSVEHLIRFIFDIESMKRTMLEFEIDLKKMPLGKLSNKQMELAYNVLNELHKLITGPEPPTKIQLLEASTKFYTFLPHDFGMKAPPIIDSLSSIRSKSEMIDNLKEIDIAFKLMNMENGEKTVDKYYENLHNKIDVVQRGSDLFILIEKYLKNSHGKTHDKYNLEIEEIFDIDRENENKRFKKFKKLSNRTMLWHGSRRTNWAGILSEGLRIAPPEAPVSGYMFGKGIYFADMVSKSANYCAVSQSSPEGLLLLCEVALGNMTERFQEDGEIKLSKSEHSCKGVGATAPDPSGNIIDDDGVIYPLGVPKKQPTSGCLLYNEYIVYDVSQVRQRYLLKVRFNFK